MTDKKTGILLLSHGSRLDDGEEVIKAYKEMYAEEFPDMPVEYGFMEIRKPGIPETIKKCGNIKIRSVYALCNKQIGNMAEYNSNYCQCSKYIVIEYSFCRCFSFIHRITITSFLINSIFNNLLQIIFISLEF